jgi:hypothetical protein
VNYGGRADLQHPRRVPDPTAIKAHLNDLPLDLGQASFVGRIGEKRLVTTLGVLASIALFVRVGLAALHYLITLTVRTRNKLVYQYHGFLLREKKSHGIMSSKSPDLQHHPVSFKLRAPVLPGERDVDSNDLDILLRDRNKPVSQRLCGQPCDLDSDETITAVDVRRAML